MKILTKFALVIPVLALAFAVHAYTSSVAGGSASSVACGGGCMNQVLLTCGEGCTNQFTLACGGGCTNSAVLACGGGGCTNQMFIACGEGCTNKLTQSFQLM